MEKSKRISQIIVFLLVVLAVVIFGFAIIKNKKPSSSQNTFLQKHLPTTRNFASLPSSEKDKFILPTKSEKPIPQEVDIPVPFSPQAPFAVWDNLHNEACEEAALIMAKYFQKGEALSPNKMEKEILSSVLWQKKNWKGHFDLSAQKMVELGQNYFDLKNIYLEKEPTINSIKKHLSQGEIVIAPTFGRNLKNPHFRGAGPIYHVLIIRGYKGDKFITNDPGTKRGKGFIYPQNNILESIHNWPGEFGKHYLKKEAVDLIKRGERIVIIVPGQAKSKMTNSFWGQTPEEGAESPHK